MWARLGLGRRGVTRHLCVDTDGGLMAFLAMRFDFDIGMSVSSAEGIDVAVMERWGSERHEWRPSRLLRPSSLGSSNSGGDTLGRNLYPR